MLENATLLHCFGDAFRSVGAWLASRSLRAVKQVPYIHADAEGDDIQIEVDAVSKAGPDVKQRYSCVESEIKSMVACEVRAAAGLLTQFVNAPVTPGPRWQPTLCNQPAEDLLRTPRCNLVERSAEAERAKEIKACSGLEMHQVAQGRELPKEESIGNRVCQAQVGERRQAAEFPVKMIGPIVGGAAGAQAFGTVAARRRSGERHPIINCRIGKGEAQAGEDVANAVHRSGAGQRSRAGGRSGGRRRVVYEIDRDACDQPHVRAEVISGR